MFVDKWDALADEDHTHHLTSQEYSLYKSNWWLHSNKQGSNTVPVTHRPDFKQALSTLPQLKLKTEGASQAPTYSHRNQKWRPVVSKDSKSLNVEQTHDRTERPVATPHTAEAQDDSRVFSIHDSDTLNVDDEVLRKRMENPLLFMTRIMNR